jgi:hypothetical protein
MPRNRDPRRFTWLARSDSGQSTRSIAQEYSLSQRTIQHEIKLAKEEVTAFVESRRLMRVPKLVLFFPINGLFPFSRCRHDVVPLPHSTKLCCAICHRSGVDNHPALQRHPRFEPRPDPVPRLKIIHANATRRQRRARLSDQSERARGVQAA